MHVDLQTVSGIAGSVSIAAWVVVFSPQILENFRRSSAEGLSVTFVFIWLIGDVFNILGAVLQGVLPTMIILAVYYTLADLVLLAQCFYYRGFTLSDKPSAQQSQSGQATSTERSPLLSNGTSAPIISTGTTASNIIIDGPNPLSEHGRRRSSFREEFVQNGTQFSPVVKMHRPRLDDQDNVHQSLGSSKTKSFSLLLKLLFNSAAILVVCAAGVLGWWLSTTHGHPHHRRQHHDRDSGPVHFNLLGQIFGYICAALYLGSRIPQLLLNFRRKSTEGVSMLFFLFACIGNATYVASILAYDPVCQRPRHCASGEARAVYLRYFLVNLSWLLGSFGTLLLDAAVFVQYFLYRSGEGNEVAVE